MISLRTRSVELEIMDDLDCHGEVVDQTLRELEVINRLLGGDHVTIDGVARLVKMSECSLTIADFGCGGGDLAMKMIRWARKRSLDVRVEGIDANPHIIDFARKNCSGFTEISFKVMDVFSNKEMYDITTATLFVHHFTDDQLVELFKGMKEHSRLGVVINDIHRHSLSYHSIRWLTSLFSKSAMVKFDAPLSVRRAFKRNELMDILHKAGIDKYELTWKWAFRWQLIILPS
jgi:2-polyprenyl-3-methyl-5-hydroxy-6-metoxy-1,4-benzoquinol methylase